MHKPSNQDVRHSTPPLKRASRNDSIFSKFFSHNLCLILCFLDWQHGELPTLNIDYREPIRASKDILFNKYFEAFNFYFSKHINELIADIALPHVILYKDYLYFDDDDEFLKRYYTFQEACPRIDSLSKFYFEAEGNIYKPNLVVHDQHKIMLKRYDRHQNLILTKLRNLQNNNTQRPARVATEPMDLKILNKSDNQTDFGEDSSKYKTHSPINNHEKPNDQSGNEIVQGSFQRMLDVHQDMEHISFESKEHNVYDPTSSSSGGDEKYPQKERQSSHSIRGTYLNEVDKSQSIAAILAEALCSKKVSPSFPRLDRSLSLILKTDRRPGGEVVDVENIDQVGETSNLCLSDASGVNLIQKFFDSPDDSNLGDKLMQDVQKLQDKARKREAHLQKGVLTLESIDVRSSANNDDKEGSLQPTISFKRTSIPQFSGTEPRDRSVGTTSPTIASKIQTTVQTERICRENVVTEVIGRKIERKEAVLGKKNLPLNNDRPVGSKFGTQTIKSADILLARPIVDPLKVAQRDADTLPRPENWATLRPKTVRQLSPSRVTKKNSPPKILQPKSPMKIIQQNNHIKSAKQPTPPKLVKINNRVVSEVYKSKSSEKSRSQKSLRSAPQTATKQQLGNYIQAYLMKSAEHFAEQLAQLKAEERSRQLLKRSPSKHQTSPHSCKSIKSSRSPKGTQIKVKKTVKTLSRENHVQSPRMDEKRPYLTERQYTSKGMLNDNQLYRSAMSIIKGHTSLGRSKTDDGQFNNLSQRSLKVDSQPHIVQPQKKKMTTSLKVLNSITNTRNKKSTPRTAQKEGASLGSSSHNSRTMRLNDHSKSLRDNMNEERVGNESSRLNKNISMKNLHQQVKAHGKLLLQNGQSRSYSREMFEYNNMTTRRPTSGQNASIPPFNRNTTMTSIPISPNKQFNLNINLKKLNSPAHRELLVPPTDYSYGFWTNRSSKDHMNEEIKNLTQGKGKTARNRRVNTEEQDYLIPTKYNTGCATEKRRRSKSRRIAKVSMFREFKLSENEML